ncbi:MAG: DUF489 family protein [Gammaproteobacteria bacterium]|nr:DUF489 family protein [Gammaproteobacteria bacterium]
MLRYLFGSQESERERVLALAGIDQAAALVQRIAVEGSAPHLALRASIRSVLALEADSVLEIFIPKRCG